MSRLSFRPRPLDIHKKLPILKSVKDLEDDEASTSNRTSQIVRFAAEADNEVPFSIEAHYGIMLCKLTPCYMLAIQQFSCQLNMFP